MFCTKCGKDNGDNNKFCIECGATLNAPAAAEETFAPEPVEQEPVVEQENVTATGKGSDKGTTILGDDTKIILTRQDGEEFKLSTFPVCLGKGSAADCIMEGDESMSRQHACIHENGDGYVIEDMNSTNKTYLNGDPLEAEELVVLNNGDEVKMGSSVFTVTII